MLKKLKSWIHDDTIFIAVLLCTIGLASFGLGRLSVVGGDTNSAVTPHKIQLVASSSVLLSRPNVSSTSSMTLQVAAVGNAPSVVPMAYVGSKSGTKYYLLTCSGVKRIKESNKVFFATVQDARAAGYTPAANCPGL